MVPNAPSDTNARAASSAPGGGGAEPRASGEMVELSRDECLELLARHRFGRLAVGTAEGPPVIRPVNYLFDRSSQSIVFRTAPGSKLHALLRGTHAAFEIDGVDERSHTGWSVIASGITEAVASEREVRRLEQIGLQPWAPGEKPHWVQIRAWTVSGRRIGLGEGSSPADPER